MRIKFIGLALIFISHSALSAAKIEQWKTSQGSPVFYVETKGLPMVDIQVVFDAGSARDGEQYGVATLTSDLFDSGAGDLSADDIAQRFESVGAYFGTGVSRDTASVSLRSLTDPKLLNKALQTMQIILSKPSFNEKDFQREKSRTLAGLKHREESPGAQAALEYFNTLYKDHPYAHSSDGITKTVEKFTANDLKLFYKQYYVANNAMIVIVGDMDKKQAMATAESLISGLSAGSKPAPLPPVTVGAKGVKKHIEFPSTQTHVLAGLIGMDRKDPHYFSFYVGNHILGGSGLVSQLFKKVREEKGLAYSASSYFAPMLKKGPFIMSLQTRNDQTTEAVNIMQKAVNDFVKKGPSEKELIAAKKNITGGFAMRIDTNSKLTNYVAMIGFHQLPLDYLDIFQAKIEAVTLSSIKSAFQERIKPEYINTITVGGRQ
jgi:zinc protease